MFHYIYQAKTIFYFIVCASVLSKDSKHLTPDHEMDKREQPPRLSHERDADTG